MELVDLGYNSQLEEFRIQHRLASFEVGRIVAEHRERYIVKTSNGDFEAEITGNLRFAANSREDFPVVGDWVAITTYEPDFAVIHQILPRCSVIKRQAVGQASEVQVIAANVDVAFLVQAIDRDFNLNRLERYLSISYSSHVSPVILLNKTDLVSPERLHELMNSIRLRTKDVPVIAISNETKQGYDQLDACMVKGRTYCLLGSSGVGKSSLVNNLSGREVMQTGSISASTQKGRHVTSHRELFILSNGGILIDNPGMREVGMAEAGTGLEQTFQYINQLSGDCKFKDCTHLHEAGCAVLEALEDGRLDDAFYRNYVKLEKEQSHYDATLAERRKRDKEFGKMMKNYKNDMKKNKF